MSRTAAADLPPMTPAAKLLQQHQSSFRVYESASDYSTWVENCVAGFANTYPTDHWEDVFSIQPDAPWRDDRDYLDDPYYIKVRSFVKWCDGCPLDLNAALETELPVWAIDFYHDIREAVLTLRNLIIIQPPEWIVHTALARSHKQDGEWPPRIVRFAETWNGRHFALRRRTSDSEWRVSLLPYFEYEAALLSPAFDYEKDDLDIASWMARMMATDGFPLRREWDEDPFVWPAELDRPTPGALS